MVSSNYQKASVLDKDYSDAWKDSSLPEKQWQIASKELEDYRKGKSCAPYDAFVSLINSSGMQKEQSILEVGCSSGYYSEVLKIAGFELNYTGLDYSNSFIKFAKEKFPGINFRVGDALNLPYEDETFDAVLSGCCILHIKDWRKAIQESARVAKKFVVFHRTPVTSKSTTTTYTKEAYGVPCIEHHFNLRELIGEINACGLVPVETALVGQHSGFSNHSILCRKK